MVYVICEEEKREWKTKEEVCWMKAEGGCPNIVGREDEVKEEENILIISYVFTK